MSSEFDDIIRRAAAAFPFPKAMDIQFAHDHAEDKCIFVRAILSDDAVKENSISQTTSQVGELVRTELYKVSELFAYFNYRSVSEEASSTQQWGIRMPERITSRNVAEAAVWARLAYRRWKNAEESYHAALDSYVAQGLEGELAERIFDNFVLPEVRQRQAAEAESTPAGGQQK